MGSLIVPKLLEKLTRFRLLFIGGLAASICITLLAFIPSLSVLWIYISLALSLSVWGVFASCVGVVINVSFMEKTDEQFLTRATGIMSSLCAAAMPVAAFLSAALVRVMDIPYILLVFGILSLAGAICTLFIKPLREL